MALQRKLGRPTDQRKAILKSLVTSLLQNGKIQTTEARAKEVKNIAEKLISIAVSEVDNFTSKQVKVSKAKLDSDGRKITKTVTSKNGRKYEVVDREIKTDMVTVDSPSRLNARRKAINWVYRVKDENGKPINVVDKLFDEIAPKYKGKNGGYTRIYKLGPRRGDAAEVVILELV
ncbi:50S ribosomal protein L17 [Clostridium thermosuccinogenes]|jgi:large subunit ribosomal protein L17|uniref:Large ribosomal subunit protein bL17 n=1 Tax=Clostridium thermosuccinogenes TaxID=84032 RepID=A0A2K2F9E2_9CLOT|nr:L17 family ribosomal protein [Pseudoclostridium thermosuccinogenes]AUS98117.1 50S ribosomal protein L17 [Pseudoclostridium thermosuccinogenes]PNT91228.1 50S ribosomal protein L17 [Pseudoclostridium thermosuccinogenes]PNT95412.1 50S ribosomal protein L17 [Pseudoclostridium thermosuccinogenes]PNT96588.1 50S ribosomal protein L17 [Pseudoclostridium thermosuccinogenes]